MLKKKTILIVCIAAVSLGLVPLADGLSRDAEYDLKAAFLAKLPAFMSFPHISHPEAEWCPTFAVLGKDPFGSRLEQVMGVDRVARFPSMRRFRESEATFDVVFVSLDDQNQLRQALGLLTAQGTLTVGDTKDFCRQGGMINLVVSRNRIKFEINQVIAEQAGLKLSSKLLTLATIVESENPREK